MQRKKRNVLPLMLAPLLLVLLGVPLAVASTGAFSGILVKIVPPRYKGPNDKEKDKKLKSFDVRSEFILYQSNTKHRTGEIVDWYLLRTDSSPAIGGWLTDPHAFARALEHFEGHHMWCYEDKHFDLTPTPHFVFGRLREIDLEKNRLVLDKMQTNIRFHYSENPVLRVEKELSAETAFKTEPWADLPREEVAKRLGRWVQVHPPCEQLIWVESEKGEWKADQLPAANVNAPRGGANSLTNNAIFHDYKPAMFDMYGGRLYRGIDITTWQNTEREGGTTPRDAFMKTDYTKELGERKIRTIRAGRGGDFSEGAVLDQWVAPYFVAQRPGRHFAANHYRRESVPHQRYFSTMNDELRGQLVKKNGRTLVVDITHWDGKKEQMEIQIDPKGRTFLDGNLVKDGAGYKEGQFIRVFPKRPTQTVFLLDEYHPYWVGLGKDQNGKDAKILIGPAAYFDATDTVIDAPMEITFDGSYSYHPDGKKIVKHEWVFGGGETATGPTVTRTYTPTKPYEKELVQLTVTDEEGGTSTWIEYVEMTKGLMPAQSIDTATLKPGMIAEAWKEGSLKDLSFAQQPGDIYHGVVNWYDMSGKDVGEKPIKRYLGWFEVGADGEHELRACGSSGEAILLIDSVPVVNTLTTKHYGDGRQDYLQYRSRVYLQKGWHKFELYHTKRQHTFTWNGPGVIFKNDHHDVGPVFHTEAEARGAQVTAWFEGKPSSAGRPLVTKDGKAPSRTGESKNERVKK